MLPVRSLIKGQLRRLNRICRHVLEDKDVGVKWSCVMEETGVPEKKKKKNKHRPWMDDHYPVTCQCPESNTGRSGDKAINISLRYSCLPHPCASCSLPPSEKRHRTWMDDHYPVTCQRPESNTGRSDDKARDIPLRYPCPPYASCSLPPSEKRHRPWKDEHYPVKCQSLESNTGCSGDKAKDNPLRYPCPLMLLLFTSPV